MPAPEGATLDGVGLLALLAVLAIAWRVGLSVRAHMDSIREDAWLRALERLEEERDRDLTTKTDDGQPASPRAVVLPFKREASR